MDTKRFDERRIKEARRAFGETVRKFRRANPGGTYDRGFYDFVNGKYEEKMRELGDPEWTLVHEAGHYLAARLAGRRVQAVSFVPIIRLRRYERDGKTFIESTLSGGHITLEAPPTFGTAEEAKLYTAENAFIMAAGWAAEKAILGIDDAFGAENDYDLFHRIAAEMGVNVEGVWDIALGQAEAMCADAAEQDAVRRLAQVFCGYSGGRLLEEAEKVFRRYEEAYGRDKMQRQHSGTREGNHREADGQQDGLHRSYDRGGQSCGQQAGIGA